MAGDPYDWDSRVEAWEEVAATDAFLALRDRIRDEASPQPGDRILDLGAGTGLVTFALAPHARAVTALDISPAMLDRLQAHAAGAGIRNVELVTADMRSLPFADETFDLVVSNYAFHHLEDASKALAVSEARRVLAPTGRLVVCDMMFSLSLQPRDRRLLAAKLWAIASRGPAGLLRIARNAGRVAVGTWEHPAPPETWQRILQDRHFEHVRVELLAQEAGIATARRPGRPTSRSSEHPSLSGSEGDVAASESGRARENEGDREQTRHQDDGLLGRKNRGEVGER